MGRWDEEIVMNLNGLYTHLIKVPYILIDVIEAMWSGVEGLSWISMDCHDFS